MKTSLIASLLLSFTSALCAQSDVIPLQKKRSDDTLIAGFNTGAKTVKISSAGTLEWVNGATLTGASYFRTAAGLAIGTNVQAYDADLTTIAAVANAAGVLTNNGSGAFSYTATSTGGNGTDDSGKIVRFEAGGSLWAYGSTQIIGPTWSSYLSSTEVAWGDGTWLARLQAPSSLSSSLIWVLPAAGGTLIGTGDTGSVTNTMLAGSIALTKLLQTSATSGQVIAWNGTTWAPATISSGLAIGSTAISGGTSGRLLLSGTTLAELTLGSGVQTALGNTVNASGGLLTYGLIGTSGTKIPLLDAANTFASAQRVGNAAGDYLAVGASSTRELRLSSNAFSIGTSAWLLGLYDSGSLQSASSVNLYIEANCAFRGDALFYANLTWNGNNLTIAREANYHAFLRLDTNANRWSVANTYSSSTNYEAAVMDWQTTANTLRIGSEVGSGGGTARDVQFIRGGVVKQTLGANTTDHVQPVKLKSYIVSGLPSAATCGAGSMAFVTDATATTAYSTVAGGGSNKVLVISDGTDWIIH